MRAFYPNAPEIKCVQDDKNTWILSSLDSDLFVADEHVTENTVLSQLSSFLSYDTVGFINRNNFSSDILTDCVRNKWEKLCFYKLVQWNSIFIYIYIYIFSQDKK